jgi:threonine dehydratase
MWRHAQELLERPIVVSVDEVTASVRLIADRARVIAEGAGAAPLAAALARPPARVHRVVCIVSGGNIDAGLLGRLITGDVTV